jgi:hypothetical protein
MLRAVNEGVFDGVLIFMGVIYLKLNDLFFWLRLKE